MENTSSEFTDIPSHLDDCIVTEDGLFGTMIVWREGLNFKKRDPEAPIDQPGEYTDMLQAFVKGIEKSERKLIEDEVYFQNLLKRMESTLPFPSIL